MAKTRESCIRNIRSQLPYLSERELQIIESFVRSISSRSSHGYSIAEYDRPVLSSEEQECADKAANCLRTLAYALTSTRGATHSCIHKEGVADPLDALVVGWDHGDLVAADVKLLMFLWNEAGWKRVRRASLMEWLERYGYILPRNKHPKTIKVNEERREVVYIFKKQLQLFVDDAACGW